MKKIKITAKDGVKYRGGSASLGDVIEVDDKTAGYFVEHGYASLDDGKTFEVGKEPIKKKAPAKKAWRKKKVSE